MFKLQPRLEKTQELLNLLNDGPSRIEETYIVLSAFCMKILEPDVFLATLQLQGILNKSPMELRKLYAEPGTRLIFALSCARDSQALPQVLLALENSGNEAIISGLVENFHNAAGGSPGQALRVSAGVEGTPGHSRQKNCNASDGISHLLHHGNNNDLPSLPSGANGNRGTQVSQAAISGEGLKEIIATQDTLQLTEVPWNEPHQQWKRFSCYLTDDQIFIAGDKDDGCHGFIRGFQLEPFARVVDIQTNMRVLELECNSEFLIAGNGKSSLWVWKKKNARTAKEQKLKGGNICAIKLRESELITASFSGSIRKWCADQAYHSIELVWEYKEDAENVSSLCCNGVHVIRTTENDTKVLRSADGSLLNRIDQKLAGLCHGLLIGLDEGGISLWNPNNVERPKMIPIGAEAFNFAFEEEGKVVAIACADKTVRVLSAEALVGCVATGSAPQCIRIYRNDSAFSVLTLGLRKNWLGCLHSDGADKYNEKVFVWKLF